jgi:hypothetical protein
MVVADKRLMQRIVDAASYFYSLSTLGGCKIADGRMVDVAYRAAKLLSNKQKRERLRQQLLGAGVNSVFVDPYDSFFNGSYTREVAAMRRSFVRGKRVFDLTGREAAYSLCSNLTYYDGLIREQAKSS